MEESDVGRKLRSARKKWTIVASRCLATPHSYIVTPGTQNWINQLSFNRVCNHHKSSRRQPKRRGHPAAMNDPTTRAIGRCWEPISERGGDNDVTCYWPFASVNGRPLIFKVFQWQQISEIRNADDTVARAAAAAREGFLLFYFG